jgi:hypothetical protein
MHDKIEDSVFEQLGRAILHAQALEEALVRENLALDRQESKLNAEAVSALEEKLRGMALGGLLKDWGARVPPNRSLLDYLNEVKDDRNLLAHRLFRDRRFKSSADYAKEISRITTGLRTAQYLIYGHNPAMTAELDRQWGISNDDRKG